MSFKDIWRPRIDGVDDADSSAVNEIAEAVINNENFINNAPNKYYNKESVNNLFANALKGSASGEAVALKDVSPLEHNLGVRVESKNLLDYTNFYTDFGSVVGYTLNEDKTLSFSGTASELFQYNFFYDSNNPIVCTEDMFVSGCPSGGAFETYCLQAFVILPNGAEAYPTEYGDGIVVSKGSKIERVFAIIRAGVNVDGLTFEPMLIKGTKKKPYTPYIADTSGVKVLTYGGNLLDVSKTGDTVGNNYETYDKDTNTITARSANYNAWEKVNIVTPLLSAGTYTFLKIKGVRTALQIIDKNLNQIAEISGYNETNMDKITITVGEPFYIRVKYLLGVTYPYTASATDFKLVVGDVSEATYEPYKEPIEYAQGEDIKSIYPSTTIMTDTKGAVISVEYNKDANKVVKSLEDRISALEAMIVSQ